MGDKGSNTREYPLPNNGKIWNAKWQHFRPNSGNTKLYESSVQEITGLDLGLEPFFETASRDRLLSCIVNMMTHRWESIYH